MARATGQTATTMTVSHDGSVNDRLGVQSFNITQTQGAVDVTGADSAGAGAFIAAGVQRWNFSVNEFYDDGSALGHPPATGAITGTNFDLFGGKTNLDYSSSSGVVISEVTINVSLEDAVTQTYSGVFNGAPTVA